jgi:hypothetical protein
LASGSEGQAALKVGLYDKGGFDEPVITKTETSDETADGPVPAPGRQERLDRVRPWFRTEYGDWIETVWHVSCLLH